MTGAMIGINSYFILLRMEDYMMKNLIWPFIYKERFRNKNSFATFTTFFIVSNYILFIFWAYIYTNFENTENLREMYFNCVGVCLPTENIMRDNFSTKILRETLIFNFYFGLMLGIYLNKEPIF